MARRAVLSSSHLHRPTTRTRRPEANAREGRHGEPREPRRRSCVSSSCWKGRSNSIVVKCPAGRRATRSRGIRPSQEYASCGNAARPTVRMAVTPRAPQAPAKRSRCSDSPSASAALAAVDEVAPRVRVERAPVDGHQERIVVPRDDLDEAPGSRHRGGLDVVVPVEPVVDGLAGPGTPRHLVRQPAQVAGQSPGVLDRRVAALPALDEVHARRQAPVLIPERRVERGQQRHDVEHGLAGTRGQEASLQHLGADGGEAHLVAVGVEPEVPTRSPRRVVDLMLERGDGLVAGRGDHEVGPVEQVALEAEVVVILTRMAGGGCPPARAVLWASRAIASAAPGTLPAP